MPVEKLNLELSDSVKLHFNELLSNMNFSCENNMEPSIRNNTSSSINSYVSFGNDPVTDRQLMLQLQEKMKNRSELLKARELLPAYEMREEILKKIEENQVVVIKGKAGCGKTTQIPQYILDNYIINGKGSLCKIVCTQPRRISALGCAERVAKERGEIVGEGSSVGYQIRLDSKLPRENGSIAYCTTGVMFHWLFKDLRLSSYSHVILDEVHERALETDILIIVLKELLKQRPSLKLILMSATMEAASFSRYFDNCPIIDIPGFTHPVEKLMLEDVIEMTNFEGLGCGGSLYYMSSFIPNIRQKYSANTIKVLRNWDEERINYDLIISLLRYICFKEDDGAILIFLPGWEEISTLYLMLKNDIMFKKQSFSFVLLHSHIPSERQQEVFVHPPEGVRKIVISTNIAETSITIEDVVYVIDSGRAKMSSFDTRKNIVKLNLCWIANSNAEQRRGRAGRVKPGKCYHLFTSYREGLLDEYRPPEIVRAKLVNVCLKIKIMNFDNIRELLSKAMDKPAPENVAISIELLKKLNALDASEHLTPLGSVLAQLPLDPRLGKMILFGAIFSCLNPLLTIAAVLEYKNPFYSERKEQKHEKERKTYLAANSESDHIVMARAFELWEKANCKTTFCKENFLVQTTMDMLQKLRQQFVNDLYNIGFLLMNDPNHPSANRNSNNTELVKGIICAGLYPNVAVKLSDGYFTAENGRVFLHPQSIQQKSHRPQYKWMLYFNKMQTTKVYLYDVTVISDILLFLFGGNLNENNVMNEWICITTRSEETYMWFKNVRETFINMINDVIKRRRILDWDALNPEMKFLSAVISHLISSENDSELSSNNVETKIPSKTRKINSNIAATLSSTCVGN